MSNMNLILIIYIILVIVLIVLAFKFMKKIVYAVMTSIVIVLISVVILGGLVYLDFQSLTQIEDATLNIVYLEGDEFLTGISFPVSTQEQGVDVSDIAIYSQDEYNSDQSLADDTFIIKLRESAFKNLENESVSLNDVIQDESLTQFIDEEITIPVSSLQQVLESQNPHDEISSIILNELGIGPALQEGARPLLVDAIEEFEQSQGLGIREASFGLLLQKLSEDESNYMQLIRLFQDGEIEVEPNKLSFTILRYLPLSFVESMISNVEEENSAMSE